MLKEACAAAVLAAAIFAPTSASSAQVTAPAIYTRAASVTGTCTSAVCKWMQDGNKRCFYCKQKKRKGGGWKRQYCEKKAKERRPVELECTSTPSPSTTNPKRVCEKCVDQKTGRLVSTKCG
ncbi:hypothetical protein GCM10009733_013620 [Nonomuraea maheshkhaliensis]|uniref:Uncharacterized protein n=1 Tax=Nonomuraea maheshkhaliensis TaxID=419590 RepID=A0ABN2EVE3_9ACTN